MYNKEKLLYESWLLVFDDFLKKYFYKHVTSGKIVFATPAVDLNALSRNIKIINGNNDNNGNDCKMTPGKKKEQ